MASLTYSDFAIQVSRLDPATGQYAVRLGWAVLGGQPSFEESATGIYDPKCFVVQEANLLEAVKYRQVTAGQLYALGGILSDLLLLGKARQRLVDSLRIARERGLGLRLRLQIEAVELSGLPWEYLYLKPAPDSPDSDQHFLALQPDVSIVRHEPVDDVTPRLESRPQYRMVAALSSPADQDPLSLDKEREAIEAMVAGGLIPLKPVWVEKASVPGLLEQLRSPADIFHFAGHGVFFDGTGKIILCRPGTNKSEYYDSGRLALLLRNARVKLAVFTACESAERSSDNSWGGIAPALVQAGLAAVVASQYRLEDRNAIPLASELYRSVLEGDKIDQAIFNARSAIYQQAGLENRDWGALVLYLRVQEGVLFPAPAAPVEQPAPARQVPALAPPESFETLVGRDLEMQWALENLDNGGKYYFYGPFGVGKTSLASQLFHKAIRSRTYQDGFLWGSAEKDSLKTADWIAGKLAETKVSEAQTRAEKLDALREVLSRRGDLLIGLDEVNDPTIARDLLDVAGRCAVILNGHARFDLAGLAREKELLPLSGEDAERLFVGLVHPGADPAAYPRRDLVRWVCEKMGRLPLGVRLAALKHAEGESLAVLRDRLQRAPATLVPNNEGLSAILATQIIDLSAAPPALNLLVRIAGFPAMQAPLAQLNEGFTSLDFYQARDFLVRQGLVEPQGADRLALHPILGVGVLRAAEPAALAREQQRAAAWLAQYASQNRDDYAALEREQANLSGLLDQFQQAGQWDELVSLIRDLFNYLRVRGQWQEAFERLDGVLSNVERLTQPWHRGWVYLHRGILHLLWSREVQALADFDRADAIFKDAGDLAYRGKVLYRRSLVSINHGDFRAAIRQLKQSITWMSDKAPAHDRAAANSRLAGLLVVQGKLADGRRKYKKALSLADEAGDAEEQARVYTALGELARRDGDFDLANQQFQHALDLAAKLGDILQGAGIEQELGYIHFYQEDYPEARRFFEKALAAYQRLSYRPGQAQIEHALGNIAFAAADYPQAAAHYQAALDTNLSIKKLANAAYNRYQLAVVAHRGGKKKVAETEYQAVLQMTEDMENKPLQAAALFQLGLLAFESKQREKAEGYLSQALDLSQHSGDREITVKALYFTGLLQAQEGHLETARGTLADAHAAAEVLDTFDERRIEEMMEALEKGKSTRGHNLLIQHLGPIKDVIVPGSITGMTLVENTADRLKRELSRARTSRRGSGLLDDIVLDGGMNFGIPADESPETGRDDVVLPGGVESDEAPFEPPDI